MIWLYIFIIVLMVIAITTRREKMTPDDTNKLINEMTSDKDLNSNVFMYIGKINESRDKDLTDIEIYKMATLIKNKNFEELKKII